MDKTDEGQHRITTRLTFDVSIKDLNVDITTDELAILLSNVLDAEMLSVIKANSKDEKWMYEIDVRELNNTKNGQFKSGKDWRW